MDNSVAGKKWYVLSPLDQVDESTSTHDICGGGSSENSIPVRKLKSIHKHLYTLILFYSMMTEGMLESGVSPALVDLKNILNASMNQISNYFTLHAIGTIAGCLVCFLFKYKFFNRQYILMVISLASGLSFAFIPHSPSLLVYYICALICGAHTGITKTVCAVWIIEMWQKDKCRPILQALYLSYGIGTIIAPVIIKPFVGNRKEVNQTSINIKDGYLLQEHFSSSLTLPFLISGLLIFFAGVFQLVMLLFCKKYDYKYEHQGDLEENNEQESAITLENHEETPINNNKDNSSARLNSMIFVSSLCVASFICVQHGFTQFSPTFSQYIEIKLSASQAAIVLTVFTTSFTIGRAISIFCSVKLHPRSMLFGNYFLTILGHAILFFWSGKEYIALIIGNILVGLGVSSFVGTFPAFIGSYLVFNDRYSTIMNLITGVLRMIIPLILGQFIETQPMSLIYVDLTLVLASLIFVSLIIFKK